MDWSGKVVAFFSGVALLAFGYVVYKLPATPNVVTGYLGLVAPVLLYFSFGAPRLWDTIRARAFPHDRAALLGVAALLLLHAAEVFIADGSLAANLPYAALLAGATILLTFGKTGATRPAWALAALVLLWLPYEFHFLAPIKMPPPNGLRYDPVLLLDAGLFLFLVYARLDGVGFDFGLSREDVLAALQEFGKLALPLAALGFALRFIIWSPKPVPPDELLLRPLGIYFLNALPEEFLFRGVMQNQLTRLIGEKKALAITAVVFGLAHIKHPWPNWRYVLMATLAGWFYGRAYQRTGKCTASAIVHTSVNLSWVTLFSF